MQLVGATRAFIRRPFLATGALHGLLGSFIAIGLLVGFLYLVQNEFSEILSFQDFQLLAILFVLVIILGVLINYISTYFAVNKYLNIKKDDLYI
jgi:cell division transport system permease protein